MIRKYCLITIQLLVAIRHSFYLRYDHTSCAYHNGEHRTMNNNCHGHEMLYILVEPWIHDNGTCSHATSS